LSSLDPDTGAVWWREPMTTSNNDSIPTPVRQGDRLLVAGLMLKLHEDEPEAAILWPQSRAPGKRILSNTSTAVLAGNHVYSARMTGALVCLDAESGEEVWSVDTVTANRRGASIHVTPNGNAAFLFTDEGNLIRARLSPKGYEELGRARLIEPTSPFGQGKFAWVPPAYANGCVFARSDEELVCARLAE